MANPQKDSVANMLASQQMEIQTWPIDRWSSTFAIPERTTPQSIASMDNIFLYLLGFAGTGKLTIAEHLPAPSGPRS